MIKLQLRILTIATLLNVASAYAQVGECSFSPSSGPMVYAPIGTTVSIHTTASTYLWRIRGNVLEASFKIKTPSWVTASPATVPGKWSTTSVDITFTVLSDTPGCYAEGPWITMEDTVNKIGCYYAFGPVVFYDPQIIGHAIWRKDTVNFGAVKLRDTSFANASVGFDSLVKYRKFVPHHVHPPFYIVDSVPMDYSCWSSRRFSDSTVWFQPTTSGHYIDTAFLLDPLTNDSLPLLLIGDGVVPNGVTTASVELPLKIYPNPCDRTGYLSLNGEILEELDVDDALGTSVRSYRLVSSDLAIDTRSLPNGSYFLRARSKGAVVSKRLLVLH